MTPTVENAMAVRHGRDLVSPELFEKLSAFCADEYGLGADLARRVMDEALAFLYVAGTSENGHVMAPSRAVDPAWHTFVLHSQEYTAWCLAHFGRYLHHAPNSKLRTVGLMYDVTGAIAAAGFAVDPSLWGIAADCNEPTCCSDGPCC
ncbi:hypothetical protein [Streptomyces sp. NPDC094032]|uniref:glycine-rich domain-containing protein n=1 Tax=Streptomyces sp. NPDC094032 TaxID=3155308 RepID=UPI0033320753